MERKSWSERINDRLKESPGEIFKAGKWRFWFPLVVLLSLVNAVLTALIFDRLTVGVVVVGVGGLMCWLVVGVLHYSDSEDSQLSLGVSKLDSIGLCFVIAHFCFLLWVMGHLSTLRTAESEYKMAAEQFNVKAESLSKDNIEIARSAENIAKENTRAERLRLRTAYHMRRAAEAGARIPAARQSSGIAPSLSTAQVELEKPKAPAQSSAGFLIKWDAWIRALNFGELILAAITLIYIRNRSAKFNAQGAALDPVATYHHKGLIPNAALRADYAQIKTPVATDWRERALLSLREHLGVIAEGLPNRSFKADLRKDEGVWVRLYKSRRGRETMIAKTCQSDKLLAAVDRPDFRERLIRELKYQGFPLEVEE